MLAYEKGAIVALTAIIALALIGIAAFDMVHELPRGCARIADVIVIAGDCR